MIAYIRGKITHKDPAFVILECNGIGYQLKISLNTYEKIKEKEEMLLHTYFQVKEDSQTLFGFFEPKEKNLFESLIGVSGVGGNTALTILSSTSPEDFFAAIESDDVSTLKKIKGIGVKTAGRIILELKGRLAANLGEGSNTGGGNVGNLKQEALAALLSLGFPKAMMEKRLDKIIKESGGNITVENLIKSALQNN